MYHGLGEIVGAYLNSTTKTAGHEIKVGVCSSRPYSPLNLSPSTPAWAAERALSSVEVTFRLPGVHLRKSMLIYSHDHTTTYDNYDLEAK